MIKINDLIFLNQLAQGVRDIESGMDWFHHQTFEKQLEILRLLSNIIIQAGSTEKDVNDAITRSEMKKTYTPCVLLKNGKLKIQLAKILNLPPSEYEKTFCLFISLFSIADERRKNSRCKNGCTHWWHKDLSKEDIVKAIIEETVSHL